ncbi:MAG: twin-arginine translocation signal domain-containing protein, partial [Verrucomicrobia bacterium]|nr:twin-arginine translocation signal domain-containing protein [Verrucomicrobiota bacterium]
MNKKSNQQISRRDALKTVGGLAAGATLLTSFKSVAAETSGSADRSNEEYVWLSANANLPLFVAHDH